MDGQIEVRPLGIGWVLRLTSEAEAALKEHTAAIAVGTVIMMALLLAIAPRRLGIALLTPVFVLTLGTLSWAHRRRTREPAMPWPGANLVLLSVALILMQAPLLMIPAFFSPAFALIAMLLIGSASAAVLPGFGAWIAMLVPAILATMLCVASILAVCFAPHLVAAHRLSVPRALFYSLRMWNRNPGAFIAFVALGSLFAVWRYFPFWHILAIPSPTLGMVLINCSWAAAGLMLASALVAFARDALESK